MAEHYQTGDFETGHLPLRLAITIGAYCCILRAGMYVTLGLMIHLRDVMW